MLCAAAAASTPRPSSSPVNVFVSPSTATVIVEFATLSAIACSTSATFIMPRSVPRAETPGAVNVVPTNAMPPASTTATAGMPMPSQYFLGERFFGSGAAHSTRGSLAADSSAESVGLVTTSVIVFSPWGMDSSHTSSTC